MSAALRPDRAAAELLAEYAGALPRWRIDTIHAPTGDHHAWRGMPGRDHIEALDGLRRTGGPPVEWAATMGAHLAAWPCGSRAYVFPMLTEAEAP